MVYVFRLNFRKIWNRENELKKLTIITKDHLRTDALDEVGAEGVADPVEEDRHGVRLEVLPSKHSLSATSHGRPPNIQTIRFFKIKISIW